MYQILTLLTGVSLIVATAMTEIVINVYLLSVIFASASIILSKDKT